MQIIQLIFGLIMLALACFIYNMMNIVQILYSFFVINVIYKVPGIKVYDEIHLNINISIHQILC